MDIFNSALKNPLPPVHKKPIANKKNSRRRHKNSHLGCGTCKKRRIKCDENLPCCYNCLKGKLDCAYLNLDSNSRNALRMAQYNQSLRYQIPGSLNEKLSSSDLQSISSQSQPPISPQSQSQQLQQEQQEHYSTTSTSSSKIELPPIAEIVNSSLNLDVQLPKLSTSYSIPIPHILQQPQNHDFNHSASTLTSMITIPNINNINNIPASINIPNINKISSINYSSSSQMMMPSPQSAYPLHSDRGHYNLIRKD